nr:MAG TPA: hypothetical protein [Caudoviricetes sp.]
MQIDKSTDTVLPRKDRKRGTKSPLLCLTLRN